MYDLITGGPEPAPGLPKNEPAKDYAPGSPERGQLSAEYQRLASNPPEIPLVIGGKEFRTGRIKEIRSPHDHSKIIGRYHEAGEREAVLAADACATAARDWAFTPFAERAAVFRKAAALISASAWKTLNAATMLGQSKNAYQAEIDATCETADFFRMNPFFAERLYSEQARSDSEERNFVDYRPLEGFVYAVSPFNFTAIAANLCAAPALMGNVVVWKPASTSVLSNWHLAGLYREAGLPPGVINFLPGSARDVSKGLLGRSDFAGLHFTGSTAVFNGLWQTVAGNLSAYRAYPRIVGETGGKNFMLMFPDADAESLVAAAIRGAFEYQGQKCSATSRLYIPRSRQKEVLELLVSETESIKMGPPDDYGNFVNAVIDEAAFNSITGYIEKASQDPGSRILAGGTYDSREGYYIRPTVIACEKPDAPTMAEEIFGPVLSVHIYDDADIKSLYGIIDRTSPYALTGAIFTKDRERIGEAMSALRNSAGNFYINDKPSGAVVGRQPFGGARGSGTNDKAGSVLNLVRWTSPRAIKENYAPPRDWRYPFMGWGQ